MPFGLEVILDGASPNAVFTYALVKNQLLYSPQGIQVVS